MHPACRMWRCPYPSIRYLDAPLLNLPAWQLLAWHRTQPRPSALPLRRFVLDGVARMRERPIEDLVDGLVQLGVDAKCTLGTGCPPVEINAQGLPSGKVGAAQQTSRWLPTDTARWGT
jgi:hypothetical protein